MIRQQLVNLIEDAIKKLQKKGIFPDFQIPMIEAEHPENDMYGDYSTNISMKIAKLIKDNPRDVATKILVQGILEGDEYWRAAGLIEGADSNSKDRIAGPGFINFLLLKECLQNQVAEIIRQGEKFGALKIGKGKKINIEFISANPTGPLTMGNGRGGFCGDVLANVLEKAGFKVAREYYINNVGEQIRKLGHSVIGDSEAVYKGDYILALRKRITPIFFEKAGVKAVDPEKVGQKAAKIILKEILKPAVKKMGIRYDVWFEESKLHKNKKVEKVLDFLKKKGLAYLKEGALWFRSTKFGDDKDRVLIKEDGETTYLASDIAYLKNKFDRGFARLIYIWGADHYGYINRIKAAAEALGYSKEKVNIIIMQLVRLFREGKEQRMSKRTGTYITLKELIDEVGLDVARFFFLTRSPGSHLNFDLDLAEEQSEKNPVYYVQYAYARICSILRKAKSQKPKVKITSQNLKLLNHPSELGLIKELIRFPEVIEDTAKDEQVQRLPQYASDLATAFHQFYRDCRVISEDKILTQARLALISATKQVLKNTLDLMGISAPERM